MTDADQQCAASTAARAWLRGSFESLPVEISDQFRRQIASVRRNPQRPIAPRPPHAAVAPVSLHLHVDQPHRLNGPTGQRQRATEDDDLVTDDSGPAVGLAGTAFSSAYRLERLWVQDRNRLRT
jgi:hypothetical protein